MKKRLIFVGIVLTMCLMSILGITAANNSGKAAFAQGECMIANAQDFAAMATSTEESFVLQNDITISNFRPFDFDKTFDGNGYTIFVESLDFDLQNSNGNIGLFASLYDAEIKNLKVVFYGFANDFQTSDFAYLNIGGLAGKIDASSISNTCVIFAQKDDDTNLVEQTFCISANCPTNFGGFAGKTQGGTTIKNCYTTLQKFCFNNLYGIANNVAGFVGSAQNTTIQNCYTQNVLSANFDTFSPETNINLAGLVAKVFGGIRCQVVNTYTSTQITFDQTNTEDGNINNKIGGMIAEIDISIIPNANAIDFGYAFASKKVGSVQSQPAIIGNAGNYDIQDCTLQNLDEQDYSVFSDQTKWSSLYPWDSQDNWSLSAGNMPVLQNFKTYTIGINSDVFDELDTTKVIPTIAFTQNTKDKNLDAQTDGKTLTLKYGTKVEIQIKINSEYKNYFKLDTVTLSGRTIARAEGDIDSNQNFVLTSPVSDQLQPENDTDYYLLTYICKDSTEGQIGITLSKIAYDFVVATENPTMGKVKNQQSSTSTDSFTVSLSYGNRCTFNAVNTSANYGFSNWKFAYEDINKDEFVLDNTTAPSNFSFVFGEKTYDEYVIGGAKLVAQWSSQICRTLVTVRLENGDLSNGCEVFDEDNQNVTETEVIFIKNIEFSLNATLAENYEFVGWYDQSGRLLSESLTLKYTPTSDEDNLSVVAKIKDVSKQASLLWLWITLGSLGVVGIIVLIVVVIVKKRKDSVYKNFY